MKMMSFTYGIFLILSAVSAIKGEDCYYATRNILEIIECPTPAENVTSIIISESNFPIIYKGLFAPFVNVLTIDITISNVEKIDPGSFDGLKLQSLGFMDNGIKSIEHGTFNSLNSTTRLDLFGNQIESLDANIFSGMASLTWLALSANKIKTIDKAAFNGLEKLEKLYLTWNKIESLEVGTFDSLINLKALYLTINLLTELKIGLFSKQIHLTSLSLEKNSLEHLPDELFKNTTALKILDVSENKLQELQENLFYGLENLEELVFSTNNIAQFDSQKILPHLPHLKEVTLYENPWKCEDLKKLMETLGNNHVVNSVPVTIRAKNSSNVDGVKCNE